MDLKFRDSLPADIVDEFDQLLAKLNQYLYVGHDPDGNHTDIVPSSVTLQGAKVGTFVDLPYDAARFTSGAGTWTVDSIDVGHLRFCRIGQLVYLQFRLTDTNLAGATSSSLRIRLPELNMYPQQDEDGFNLQMAGLAEIEDADGTAKGWAQVSVDNLGSSPATFVTVQKWNSNTFALRDFQIGGISVMGSLMFMVNVNNSVRAFG